MLTENYIGPMNVSFQGIKVAEIPCTNAIPPEGWFATTNYTGSLTHDRLAGAGYLHPIRNANYWTPDEAGREVVYNNWAVGRLVWRIPIGWKRMMYDGDSTVVAFDPDFESFGDSESRPLLIGGSEDAYLEIMLIESDGTASVEKFGYKLSRPQMSFRGTIIPLQ